MKTRTTSSFDIIAAVVLIMLLGQPLANLLPRRQVFHATWQPAPGVQALVQRAVFPPVR